MLPLNMTVSEISAGERRMAEAAGEGRIALRTSMKLGVSFEILMACEATVTNSALKWLLSSHCRNSRHRRVVVYIGPASTMADQWNEA